MITDSEYNNRIDKIASQVIARIDQRLSQGWIFAFALDDALADAAGAGRDEATIQMMTFAAGLIATKKAWDRAGDFVLAWNARFPDAPRVESGGVSLAAPCMTEIGGVRAAIAAPWSGYLQTFGERADT